MRENRPSSSMRGKVEPSALTTTVGSTTKLDFAYSTESSVGCLRANRRLNVTEGHRGAGSHGRFWILPGERQDRRGHSGPRSVARQRPYRVGADTDIGIVQAPHQPKDLNRRLRTNLTERNHAVQTDPGIGIGQTFNQGSRRGVGVGRGAVTE